MRRIILALALVLGASLISPPIAPAQGRGAQVDDFPNKARAHIVISQDEQKMYIYEGNRAVKIFPVSTGWPGIRRSITPVFEGLVGEYWGTFDSYGSRQDHGYYLTTDYLALDGEPFEVPGSGAWNGDILIHSAPYQYGSNGEKLYDRSGIGTSPTSHGCIRMMPEDIDWFQRWDPTGVSIKILWFSGEALAFPKHGLGAQLVGAVQGAPAGTGAGRP